MLCVHSSEPHRAMLWYVWYVFYQCKSWPLIGQKKDNSGYNVKYDRVLEPLSIVVLASQDLTKGEISSTKGEISSQNKNLQNFKTNTTASEKEQQNQGIKRKFLPKILMDL